MVADKIQAYLDIINSLTWIDKGVGMILLYPLVIISGVGGALLIPLTITGVVLKVKKRKTMEDSSEVQEEQEKQEGQPKDDGGLMGMFIDHPKVSFALVVSSFLFLWFFGTWEDHMISKEGHITRVKEELLQVVFTDYLNNYDGEVHQPKDMSNNTRMVTNSLYETTMMVDGVKLNDQLIYVIYSDKLESDTLVPFDATAYADLIPTDEQRQYFNKGSVLREKQSGLMVEYKPQGSRFNSYVYIDNIDFIYNVKIQDKE